MNQLRLVWRYLVARPLNTALQIGLLALGISMITVLVLTGNQLREKMASNTGGIDLVVGAKGSPMQLILSSIFHIDVPTGNIQLSEAEKFSRHRLVKNAIPMALGDSYGGFRLVGTTKAYPELYAAILSEGKWFSRPLEVTVGSTAAQQLRLKTGDTFVSAHGLTSDGHGHEEHVFVVSGILQPTHTVIDQLLLTRVESVWIVHDQGDTLSARPARPSRLVPSVDMSDTTRAITSLLLQYRNPLAVIQLPRLVNSDSRMQAAAPAFELARLVSLMGVGTEVLAGFAAVLILISALSIFLALYNSLRERQYDLAIMRSMGAGRQRLMMTILLEGVAMSVTGSLAGVGLGHGVLAAFIWVLPEAGKAGLSAGVWYAMEGWLLAGSVALGVLCALLPAVQAYRTDIHKVLAGN